mgnify:FL=1|jgi:hypothetical protein
MLVLSGFVLFSPIIIILIIFCIIFFKNNAKATFSRKKSNNNDFKPKNSTNNNNTTEKYRDKDEDKGKYNTITLSENDYKVVPDKNDEEK